MSRKYTAEEIEESKEFLRMRRRDPIYKITSSPLTYLAGGLVCLAMAGANEFLANFDQDPTSKIHFLTYVYGGFAGLNYLASGFYNWAWRTTKKIARENPREK